MIFATVRNSRITKILGDLEPGSREADRIAQQNAGTVCLDLADDETPRVGDEVEIDDEGVATLVGGAS